jgi:hypothetical protein
MMTYFKKTIQLTEEEKKQVSEMAGKIMLWKLEGRSLNYMAENLKIEPHMVINNIFENIRELKQLIGFRLYLKIWFRKRCWKK